MGKTLMEIAADLQKDSQQVQLIYAFNGVGKTRLSRAFKENISPKDTEGEEGEKIKFIYYNAFTEDLFSWDNDLDDGVTRKLIIRPNGFTNWILKEEGRENNIITLFQHYTNNKLSPRFSESYDEISFSLEGGNEETIENIKISKGEESCFIWCIFYSLLQEIVEVLSIAEPEDRSTHQFDHLEYIFIDDPVSSLDENHLIELAVNIATLITKSPKNLKYTITTHNPLFYNVLYNELHLKKENKKKSPCAYMLSKTEDGTYDIIPKFGDSNKSFSYHLFLKQTIQEAIDTGNIQKYHFTLLRNLYEKTANFLGYEKWSELLPDDKTVYYSRIINYTSHSTLSTEMIAEPTEQEKKTVSLLLNHLIDNSRYWKEKEEDQNDTI